jgi:uncharacterized protein (DUF433 family)
MTVASNTHITIDDQGVARIDATRMKVIHLVQEKLARKATPEQLHEAYPELSLAQIHAALAFYYDHQADMDAEISKGQKDFDAAKSSSSETPGRKKLRDSGLRP